MPDTSKLEKLNRELEKSEKKLRKAINDEKALQHQLKQLTRKERTHRLCTRGGMLESFLQEPERLTDDDVMLLLKLIFHRQDTQKLLKKLLERQKPETPSFTKGAIIHHPEVCALRSPKAPRRRAVIFRSHGLIQIKQGTLRFPCAGCRQLPFCGLAIWGHLALQAVPSRQVLQNLSIL